MHWLLFLNFFFLLLFYFFLFGKGGFDNELRPTAIHAGVHNDRLEIAEEKKNIKYKNIKIKINDGDLDAYR